MRYLKADFERTLQKIQSDTVLDQNEIRVLAHAFYKIHGLENNKACKAAATRRKGEASSLGRNRSSNPEQARNTATSTLAAMKNVDITGIIEILEECIARVKN